MPDETEPKRRELVAKINASPRTRAELEARYGKKNVWDTKELGEAFEVHSFMAPFTTVTRKSDGVVGTLVFQHLPRFYFGFENRRDMDDTLRTWTKRD